MRPTVALVPFNRVRPDVVGCTGQEKAANLSGFGQREKLAKYLLTDPLSSKERANLIANVPSKFLEAPVQPMSQSDPPDDGPVAYGPIDRRWNHTGVRIILVAQESLDEVRR